MKKKFVLFIEESDLNRVKEKAKADDLSASAAFRALGKNYANGRIELRLRVEKKGRVVDYETA